MISQSSSLGEEITHRINRAAKTYGHFRSVIWKNRSLTRRTKLKLYNAIIIPTVLYSAETWATCARDLQRLETFHMRCMRDITNIKWYYRVSNVSIRSKILVPYITSVLRLRRLKWFGHVNRMGKERLPHQLLFGELEAGKRPQSKPPKRWKDCINDDLQKFQIPSGTLERDTQDREKWIKRSSVLTPTCSRGQPPSHIYIHSPQTNIIPPPLPPPPSTSPTTTSLSPRVRNSARRHGDIHTNIYVCL